MTFLRDLLNPETTSNVSREQAATMTDLSVWRMVRNSEEKGKRYFAFFNKKEKKYYLVSKHLSTASISSGICNNGFPYT